jgi:hypothetical protein
MPVSFLKKVWKNGNDPGLVVGSDPETQASEYNRLENGINDTATVANANEAALAAHLDRHGRRARRERHLGRGRSRPLRGRRRGGGARGAVRAVGRGGRSLAELITGVDRRSRRPTRLHDQFVILQPAGRDVVCAAHHRRRD